jgi:hypothetical protein
MADLSELIARVEGAKAANYGLEVEIASALEPDLLAWRAAPPPYTCSLDVALALCKRALPGLYMWNIVFDDEPTDCPYEAHIYGAGCEGHCSGPNAALALISALLRALHHKEQEHG